METKTNKRKLYTVGAVVLVIIVLIFLFKLLFNWDVEPNKEESSFSVSRVKLTKSTVSKYNKNIIFDADLLIFNDISNNKLLNYFYEDILPSSNYVGVSKSDLETMLAKKSNDFIKENANHGELEEIEDERSYSYIMNIKYCGIKYICVEVHQIENFGGGTGASCTDTKVYKNVNYLNGQIVKLSDIINVNILTKELLYENFEEFAKDDSGRNVSLDDLVDLVDISEELYYPDNFTFDSEGIIFIYPKYSIGAGYLGEISFTIPYWKILGDIKPDFRKNVIDTKPLQIIEK